MQQLKVWLTNLSESSWEDKIYTYWWGPHICNHIPGGNISGSCHSLRHHYTAGHRLLAAQSSRSLVGSNLVSLSLQSNNSQLVNSYTAGHRLLAVQSSRSLVGSNLVSLSLQTNNSQLVNHYTVGHRLLATQSSQSWWAVAWSHSLYKQIIAN